MSNKTVMSFKVDKDVRENAQKAAKKLGLPLSTIVNHQLKRFAEEQRIEFRPPLTPNAKTKKIIDEALRDIHEGRDDKFSPKFANMEDAITWLHKKK